MTFGCGHVAMHKKYMGEGVGFPQVRAVVSLVIRVCPWFVCGPKVFQLCINQLVVWLVQGYVNNELTCHFS